MRSEQEMMHLILGRAERDARIRAVILSGSRAVPSAPKDIYQDYDIIYVVTGTESFVADPRWIDCFGERIMLQKPVEMEGSFNGITGGVYNYLMLFTDGNRIDLVLCAPDTLPEIIAADPVGIPLLDKDGLLGDIAFAGEEYYLVKKPDATRYYNTCNEFWWVMQNVAKGVMRRQAPYAMGMLDYCRDALCRVLYWYAAERHGWNVPVGKFGKNLAQYLPRGAYQQFLDDCWPQADEEGIRNAIGPMCALFRRYATLVADHHQLHYPTEEDAAMSAYLQAVLHTGGIGAEPARDTDTNA